MGFSLGWLLPRPIPEGCRFLPVRVLFLLHCLWCLLRTWLLLPGMASSMGLVISWAGGIPSQSAPFSRNCSIRPFVVVGETGWAFLVLGVAAESECASVPLMICLPGVAKILSSLHTLLPFPCRKNSCMLCSFPAPGTACLKFGRPLSFPSH